MPETPTVNRLPRWAPPAAALGGGAVLLLWWRKRAAAGSAPGSSAAASGYGTTGNSAVDSGSAYGAPLPVSVLPPITLTPQNFGGDSTTQFPPPVTPTGPPSTPTVNQTPTPPPPAPTLQQTPPTPAPSLTNLPANILQQIQASGEHIVKGIVDPKSGGTWWLGSKGGVFSVGGAPFLGSARPYGFDDPNVRSAADIQYLGNGYQVVSSRGEIYQFPG